MTSIRTTLASLAAIALTFASPVAAQTNNANPGNAAPGTGRGGQFEFERIPVPEEDRRGVFISQIGATNRTEARQSGSNSYVRIIQNGDENQVDIGQDEGNHHASIAQDGNRNTANVGQQGQGRTVLMLAQQGDGNRADVSQTESQAIYSAAAIGQTGSDNLLSLVQDGSDNQARLIQNGDGNAMTAIQQGNGNRLSWTQDGNGLSDLRIMQDGGQAMEITQTNTGAPPSGNGGG